MIPLPPLYPITDARRSISLSAQVRRYGDAGYPLVQFRGKPLPADAQWAELRQALRDSHDRGGWPLVVLNDRADLAVMAAREGLPPWGLHLGQEDLPPSEARRLPGLGGLHLGTSTHGEPEWLDVDPACDHAGVGPVRGTATKADHARPIGFGGLREGASVLRSRGLAPVAIGGLGMGDLEACFAAGAASVAMVSALGDHSHPGDALWEAQAARWRAQPPLRRGQGLVLCGSSGAGKSTVGAALAQALGLPFVDLDAVIEAAEGCPIPDLFRHRGEAAFRDLETRHAAGTFAKPCVLALGGGAWELEGVREAARASGFAALWLAERPELCWARISGDPHRPLATTREAFLARHRQRLERWSEVPQVLPLGRDPNQIAEALASAID